MTQSPADSFLTTLRKSQLLTEERLRDLLAEFEQSGVDITAPKAVARSLVKQGVITRWQAENLLKGKHRGYSLGKYRLLSLLGKGGMSAVYLAEHTLMRRRCALKVLPGKRVGESSYLGRFHREAQAVASLDHPNIVRAYDVDSAKDRDNDIHFLVMEYVEGRDLQIIVDEDGPLEFPLAAEYVRQSAEGLGHAHESGLIHRDVKPANLLVDPNGVVKILDLGLARFFAEEDENSLTVANDEKVLGTADYLAPEQAVDSHTVDARADQYALGCSFYFLLCGHPPFDEGTLTQRLLAHQSKEPSPISDERENVPPELAAILQRMMSKNPEARFPTMRDVAAALEGWLVEHGGRPERRNGARPTAPRNRTPDDTEAGETRTDGGNETVTGSGDEELTSFLTNLDSRPAKPSPPKPKSGVRSTRAATAVATKPEVVSEFPSFDTTARAADEADIPIAEADPDVAEPTDDDEALPVAEPDVADLVTENRPASSIVRRRKRGARGGRSKSGSNRILAIGGGVLALGLLVFAVIWFNGGDGGKQSGGIDPSLRKLTVGPKGHFDTLSKAVAHIVELGKGREDEWMILVEPGEYLETLNLSEGDGFPPNVTFEATDGDVVILPPPDSGADATIRIEGVENVVLRGLVVEAGELPSAVQLEDLCAGTTLENLELRHPDAVGVHCYGTTAFDGGGPAKIDGCTFRGSTGIQFDRSLYYPPSQVVVSGCRFDGAVAAIIVNTQVEDVQVRENLFTATGTGLDFALGGDISVGVLIGNNTFQGVERPIHFDRNPIAGSPLVVARNLFVDQETPEVTVDNGRDQQRFDGFGMSHNWSSRAKPEKVDAKEIDVFTKGGGKRGAEFEFVSTDPKSAGFLKPKPKAPHGSVNDPQHGLKPFLGARAP